MPYYGPRPPSYTLPPNAYQEAGRQFQGLGATILKLHNQKEQDRREDKRLRIAEERLDLSKEAASRADRRLNAETNARLRDDRMEGFVPAGFAETSDPAADPVTGAPVEGMGEPLEAGGGFAGAIQSRIGTLGPKTEDAGGFTSALRRSAQKVVGEPPELGTDRRVAFREAGYDPGRDIRLQRERTLLRDEALLDRPRRVNWKTVETSDGNYVQVHPRTGMVRPISMGGEPLGAPVDDESALSGTQRLVTRRTIANGAAGALADLYESDRFTWATDAEKDREVERILSTYGYESTEDLSNEMRSLGLSRSAPDTNNGNPLGGRRGAGTGRPSAAERLRALIAEGKDKAEARRIMEDEGYTFR